MWPLQGSISVYYHDIIRWYQKCWVRQLWCPATSKVYFQLIGLYSNATNVRASQTFSESFCNRHIMSTHLLVTLWELTGSLLVKCHNDTNGLLSTHDRSSEHAFGGVLGLLVHKVTEVRVLKMTVENHKFRIKTSCPELRGFNSLLSWGALTSQWRYTTCEKCVQKVSLYT